MSDGRPELSITLHDQHVAGTFAKGVRVGIEWQQFVLDFLVRDDRSDEQTFLVVQRVRLDASAMQDALGTLSSALSQYEEQFGDPRFPTTPTG